MIELGNKKNIMYQFHFKYEMMPYHFYKNLDIVPRVKHLKNIISTKSTFQ